jgi:hypothetical protein
MVNRLLQGTSMLTENSEDGTPTNRMIEDIEIVLWIKDKMIELEKPKAAMQMKLVVKCWIHNSITTFVQIKSQ